ncbi:MAG: hypothetical protein GY953_40080, partial [bacterium]|nr:hypothetical protein [bacterium]
PRGVLGDFSVAERLRKDLNAKSAPSEDDEQADPVQEKTGWATLRGNFKVTGGVPERAVVPITPYQK